MCSKADKHCYDFFDFFLIFHSHDTKFVDMKVVNAERN